jgi:NADH-quinone oxidoreductase subunit C
LSVVDQLRTLPELKFDWFVDLCGVDYLGRHPRFETVVHLYSRDLGRRIRI